EATMQAEPISAAARVLVARKDPKAAEVLFNFVPSVGTDAHLEEEVLACLGRLTITSDSVDALILKGMKDPLPFRRTVSGYLIGRRAGVSHRQELRDLLADKDQRVRDRVAEGMFGKRATSALQDALTGDEALLKGQKIDPTEAALLEFFRKRTLGDDEQKRL